MEREVTPAQQPPAVSSVRPTPCVLWLPTNDQPPQHLVKSLEQLGLKVTVTRHRYEALAEAILSTTTSQLPTSDTRTPIAVVLVEPNRLIGADDFRDALTRLNAPIARWRYDPSARPAFARDEHTTNEPQHSQQHQTTTSQTEQPQHTPTETPPTQTPPPARLRLVHDDEQTEPNHSSDRQVQQHPHQPPPPPIPTLNPNTPKPQPQTPQQQQQQQNQQQPPDRITLTDDELAMLLADDDEFQRLEQRPPTPPIPHSNIPPSPHHPPHSPHTTNPNPNNHHQPNHKPKR